MNAASFRALREAARFLDVAIALSEKGNIIRMFESAIVATLSDGLEQINVDETSSDTSPIDHLIRKAIRRAQKGRWRSSKRYTVRAINLGSRGLVN